MNEWLYKSYVLEIGWISTRNKGRLCGYNYHISISHYTASNRHNFSYHDNISFKHDTDVEERIEKALDYVRSLGGNNNEG